MSDLISRNAILKNIEKIRQSAQMMDDTHRADIIMTGMYLCEEAVRNQPSAQSERKRGKWIPVNNGRGGHECDQCHNYAPAWQTGEEHLTDFCPFCGADMRGEANDR